MVSEGYYNNFSIELYGLLVLFHIHGHLLFAFRLLLIGGTGNTVQTVYAPSGCLGNVESVVFHIELYKCFQETNS